MTNEERLKNDWISEILSLNPERMYELISEGTIYFEGGLCKLCTKQYPPCDENLDSDDICIERFSTWCKREVGSICNRHYKLVAVTDIDGRDKASSNEFYRKYIGFITGDMIYDMKEAGNEYFRLWIYFDKDDEGNWVSHRVHTTGVRKIVETDAGFNIYTKNSIYIFESVDYDESFLTSTKNLIELFLSSEVNGYFCRGIYYDEDGNTHILNADLHINLLANFVELHKRTNDQELLMRFLLSQEGMVLSDVLRNTEIGYIPLLIHNMGNTPIQIGYMGWAGKHSIMPNEDKIITPYERDI